MRPVRTAIGLRCRDVAAATVFVVLLLGSTVGVAGAGAQTNLPLYPDGAVSCASSGFCLAGDQDFVFDSYAGGTWLSSVAPLDLTANDQRFTEEVISCVEQGSDPFCAVAGYVAVGVGPTFTYQLEFATYSGLAWKIQLLGGPIQPVRNFPPSLFGSISCANASLCIATTVNSGSVYLYNGSGWSGPTAVDAPGLHTSSGAPGLTTEGTVGNVTTSDGTSTLGVIDGVSCAPGSTSWCVAVDAGGPTFLYVGGVWSGPSVGASAPSTGGKVAYLQAAKIACTAVKSCAEFAAPYTGGAAPAGGAPAIATFDGSSWSTPSVATFALPFSAASDKFVCESGGASPTCEVVTTPSAGGQVTTWANSSWSAPHTVPGIEVDNISCWSVTNCLGVGPAVASAVDGWLVTTLSGGVWSTPVVATDLTRDIHGAVIAAGQSAQSVSSSRLAGTTIPLASATVVAKTATVAIGCMATSCVGKVALTAQVQRKERVRGKTVTEVETVVLGDGSYRLAKGQDAQVNVHLNLAGRSALRNASAAHPIRETVTVTSKGKHASKLIVVT